MSWDGKLSSEIIGGERTKITILIILKSASVMCYYETHLFLKLINQ